MNDTVFSLVASVLSLSHVPKVEACASRHRGVCRCMSVDMHMLVDLPGRLNLLVFITGRLLLKTILTIDTV